MAITTILDGTQVIDNLNSTSPLDWGVVLPNEILLNEGLWFASSYLQLQLQIFMSVTTNQVNTRRNTERFLNPSQSQIGHWALLSDFYVVDDDRIKYEKTAIFKESPQLQIGKTIATSRIGMATTINTKAGHAQNVADAPICGTARGFTPPVAAAVLDHSSVLPTGALCLKTINGAIEMTQQEVYEPTGRDLVLKNSDYGLPDILQGVLWGGYRLEVGWILGYHQYDSLATFIPPAQFVVGSVVPAIYSYSCAFGVPVPNPLYCSPLIEPELSYNPDGSPKFDCPLLGE